MEPYDFWKQEDASFPTCKAVTAELVQSPLAGKRLGALQRKTFVTALQSRVCLTYILALITAGGAGASHNSAVIKGVYGLRHYIAELCGNVVVRNKMSVQKLSPLVELCGNIVIRSRNKRIFGEQWNPPG